MARAKKGSGRVVEILESKRPVEALRKFLAKIGDQPTLQEGQIALGAAQLALVGDEVDAAPLIDLVLAHWERFPDRSGFHAEAFLRNAFDADDDPVRLERLLMYATASGIDLVDEEVALPAIPVRIEPHMRRVRQAVDALVTELDRLGQPATTRPPASLDDVLAAEAESRIQLPNDYRAMLTITDGLAAWEHTFLGTKDYRSAELVRDCVPIANGARPTDWLLYDPRGQSYVLMLDADELPLDDLVAALDRIGRIAADVLATN